MPGCHRGVGVGLLQKDFLPTEMSYVRKGQPVGLGCVFLWAQIPVWDTGNDPKGFICMMEASTLTCSSGGGTGL